VRFPKPRILRRALLSCVALYALLIWRYYPARTDAPEAIHFQPTAEQQDFYNVAFDPRQAEYERVAAETAARFGIRGAVANFAATHLPPNAHVLEVGSGAGSLQDIVADYTGLDISATAKSKYHKRFVQADARAMPFRDGEFDGLWSIWVLEHVPNPEQALREIRRVLKPGGVAFLFPAWACSELAPQGYPVRPYSDFGLGGKLIKATVPLAKSDLFQAAYTLPIRLGRLAAWKLHNQPTALHYRPIAANYREYWMPDSDAVNSIDLFETYLWFRSRGDECLECLPESQMVRIAGIPLVIRKSGGAPLQTARTR
jgi:ubiquinone/menaquinone biosynthesis C-methylase UbiE